MENDQLSSSPSDQKHGTISSARMIQIHLMLLILLSICSVGAAADVQLDASTQGGDACPGETITFTCIGTNLTVIQIWDIDDVEIVAFTSGTILGTSSRDVSTSVGVVMFMLDLLENTVVSSALRNFTSILNVTATPELNGHTITCGDDSVQMSEPINVAGPPSSPSLRPLSYTCYSVVIEWEPPQDDGGGNVSYTCTISGPGDYNVTVPNCNSPFTIDNITVNTDYTVNVMATNCAGDETSSVPIRIVASETGPPQNLTIQLDCSVDLELTVTWMNPTVSVFPAPSLPLVCPIEDIVCRINGNEIAECNAASVSFTRSVTEGMDVVEVVIRNVVGDSVPSTASINAFALRVSSDDGCAIAVTVTLNDECRGELMEFGGALLYEGQSDPISFMSGYVQEVPLSNATAGTMFDYTVNVTQNGALVDSKTGSLTYGIEASTGLPPDCDLDGGVSETDCVDPNPNPSEPLTATCFCSGSDDVIIIFNGRWPDPQCGEVSSDEKTTLNTAASIGLTFAITFVVSMTIGTVVASTICYCYFKRKMKVSISQPQAALYEEMSGENLRPSTTQAMEMKDNRAYGPVTPRGGPVYEVPGGGGAAVRSNQGILVGENVAYGPVS